MSQSILTYKPDPRLTRDNALLAARSYIRQGLAEYEYSLAKNQAAISLYLGHLEHAIYHTQVALFLARLRKVWS